MNQIKGLLKKDILLLKSYKKNFILSLLIYTGIILLNTDNSDSIIFSNMMIIFLFNIYGMATFNYDEKSNANKYILTMPISRKDYVLSKYTLLIISIILGMACGLMIDGILYAFNIIKILNIASYLETSLGLVIALSIVQAIQIPCIFKYGAEKGRLQIYIIAMIFSLIIGIIYFIFPNINLNFLNSIEKFLPFIIIIIIILNYFISYKISLKIFSKKEL